MTKQEILEIVWDYWNASTFPAFAGESCRSCPTARDGGCTQPHDEDCRYGRAEKRMREMLEVEGVIKKRGT